MVAVAIVALAVPGLFGCAMSFISGHSTTARQQPPPPEIVTRPGALNEPDWISPQVPKPDADGWIILFDGKRLYGCSPAAADIASGKVGIQDGCLRLDSTLVSFDLYCRDVVIRARLKRVSGENCGLHARCNEFRHCGGAVSQENYFFLGHNLDQTWRGLAGVRSQEHYPGFFEMELRVEGENLTLKADGHDVCHARENLLMEAGKIWVQAYNSVALYQSIEARILDKTPSTPTGATMTTPTVTTGAQPPPQGTATNPSTAADWKRGLVLYFSFDEPPKNGVVRDESGTGNDGRAVNARWTAQGRRGGALQFDRTNSYVTVPNRPSLNPAQITIAAWIKTSYSGGVWCRIFDKSFDKGFALSDGGDVQQYHAKGQLDWEIGGSSGDSKAVREINSRPLRIDDGRWHHVAGTYDGTVQRLYLDGELLSQERRWKGRVPANNYDLTIAANRSDPAADEVGASFDGLIDEAMMFNRALSPDEVRQLYERQ